MTIPESVKQTQVEHYDSIKGRKYEPVEEPLIEVGMTRSPRLPIEESVGVARPAETNEMNIQVKFITGSQNLPRSLMIVVRVSSEGNSLIISESPDASWRLVSL